MSVVRLWVYECCKMVGGTSCGFGVGVPLVYEVIRWWVVLPVGWGSL